MQFFFIISCFISIVYSQAILHSPIEEAVEKTPILIEAFIDLPDYEIKKVTLFFRKKGEVKYLESPMFKIDAEFLGEIPIDPKIGQAGDDGKPLVELDQNSAISKIYLDFAKKIKSSYL